MQTRVCTRLNLQADVLVILDDVHVGANTVIFIIYISLLCPFLLRQLTVFLSLSRPETPAKAEFCPKWKRVLKVHALV